MIFGVYGKSDSGKTTLVVKLIEVLKHKGYNVGSVKHIHEQDFTIDTENKDTWKHSRAGSSLVVAHSGQETAFLVNEKLEPKNVVAAINNILDLDIVIVEGYWDDDHPKVALGDIEEKGNTVLRYKDNFDEIVEYIVEGIEVERIEIKLPDLNCGKCGFEKCIEFAQSIYKKANKFDDCHYFSEMKISLEVDGKKIPMGRCAKEMVTGTIAGMISSLKEVGEGKDIRIEINK
jgi:molybdopterin-guanine dinucleotide biosynthesis protein B